MLSGPPIPRADVKSPGLPQLQELINTHLSFLCSPWEVGLTAILGNVEAEVWGWLQEDRVSTFSGDRGGVLHSECDNEPAGEKRWHDSSAIRM